MNRYRTLWDDPRNIERLRELWAAEPQISASEIGHQLGGISKNAVIGKARRLNLPERGSPIRRFSEGYVPPPRNPRPPRRRIRINGKTVTLPASATDQPPVDRMGPTLRAQLAEHASAERRAQAAVQAALVPVRPEPEPEPEPEPRGSRESAVTTFKPRRRRECCWPIGRPGERDFRFCSAEGAPGKPYCEEHAELAYVKPRSGERAA